MRDVPLRRLPDDTLLVFLSDSHIGGDGGRDIFEAPEDLAALFDAVDRHAGPVELVLAGDFFDFLRIAGVPAGETRASATTGRPEYRDLFAALRRLAAGESRRVVYLPGNHDAEAWWNPAIQAELRDDGLVHEFALAYAAAFASAPEQVVYCEHGNELDPANAIHDYADPLDTPLGHHIVTDLVPRIPHGRTIAALRLSEVDRVFPLTAIPEWVAGRLFYDFVTFSLRRVLAPLALAYAAYELLAWALGAGGGAVDAVVVDLAYDFLVLLVGFVVLILVARRAANRAIRSAAAQDEDQGKPAGTTVEELRRRLEGERPPLAGQVAVFVSGHTHAPSLEAFRARGDARGALVNAGCWLRQLRAVPAHLGMPPVVVSRVVQTHVRVTWGPGAIEVELWEHPRPFPERMLAVERLFVAGRRPAEPPPDARPRVGARTSVALSALAPSPPQ